MEASLVTETNPSEQMISEGAPIIEVPAAHGTPSPSEPPVSSGVAGLASDTPISFPEVAILHPCSYLECANGHQWGAMLALAKCGHGTAQGWMGCGAPILAVKLVNCPVCNEPNTKFKIRIDNTPPVPFPIPLCIPGSTTHAEAVFVEIPWRKWKETEEAELAKLGLTKEKEQNGQTTIQE